MSNIRSIRPWAPETHQQNEQQKEQRFEALLRGLGQAVARLVMAVSKPAQVFVPAYKAGVLEALLRENPRMSISELSLRSGIDRRQISQFLKQKRICERKKRNKLIMILSDLECAVRRSGNGCVARKGADGFDAICRRYASGDYSPGAILKELQRLGNVIDRGEQVELVSPFLFLTENHIEFLSVMTWSVEQLIESALYNKTQSNIKLRNFHRNIYSTRIPFEKRAQVHAELRAALEKQRKELRSILEKHEIEVAVGTYAPIGVTLLQIGRPHGDDVSDMPGQWT